MREKRRRRGPAFILRCLMRQSYDRRRGDCRRRIPNLVEIVRSTRSASRRWHCSARLESSARATSNCAGCIGRRHSPRAPRPGSRRAGFRPGGRTSSSSSLAACQVAGSRASLESVPCRVPMPGQHGVDGVGDALRVFRKAARCSRAQFAQGVPVFGGHLALRPRRKTVGPGGAGRKRASLRNRSNPERNS